MIVPSIPRLEDYGLSASHGFLGLPHRSSLSAEYKQWEEILSQLPQLIANGDLATAVASLPHLDGSQLSSDADLQHAYVCLGFIIHGHVWGTHAASTKHATPQIPPQLSEPFLEVCKRIGTEPVLSYSGLCLWNWCTKDKQECSLPLSLGHLQTFGSFTGTIGEAAFYLVPVLIEAEGAHLIPLLLEAVRAASTRDFDYVKAALKETTATLDKMSQHLPKLYPLLDAKMFYHELRPFLAGGKGAEDKGLPRGMVFQRSDGSELDIKCIGGSAAQSSLFPFLDAVLGVSHGDPSSSSVIQVCQDQFCRTCANKRRKCDGTCLNNIGSSCSELKRFLLYDRLWQRTH